DLLGQLHRPAAEGIVAVLRAVHGHVERVRVVAVERVDVGAGLDQRLRGLVLTAPGRPVDGRGAVQAAGRARIGAGGDESSDFRRIVAAGRIAEEIGVDGAVRRRGPITPRAGTGRALRVGDARAVAARRAQ